MSALYVLGFQEDIHVQAVLKEVRAHNNAQIEFINSENFGKDLRMSYTYDSKGLTIVVELGEKLHVFNTDTVVWIRRVYPLRKGDSRDGTYHHRNRAFYVLLEAIYLVTDSVHFFPIPEPMHRTENKIYQLAVAKKSGLKIPETTIGNSITSIIDHWESDEEIVVKPLALSFLDIHRKEGTKRIEMPTKVIKTKTIEQASNRVFNTPFIAQTYIHKAYELRITVVGKELFVSGFDSQGSKHSMIDSRMNEKDDVEYWIELLPRKVKEAILRYMSNTGMNFACIDMIVTPDGEYVFLESNPNGQWLWIEQKTGLPIAAAIAKQLTDRLNL